MADRDAKDVMLNTLHENLEGGFTALQGGAGDLDGEILDLKVAFIGGFRNLPSRETGEEMVRLLREGNRRQEERFAQLDTPIRERHLEIQQTLRAMIDGIGGLSVDIGSHVARIDALIRGRHDGAPSS